MPDTPDSPAVSRAAVVLGFDYGQRTIGVAVGQRMTADARPLTTIASGDWARLDALFAEWQPACAVIGLPLTLDGEEQSMSRAVRNFARALERRYRRSVHLVDERFSSREAAHRFAALRARGIARRRDANAIDAQAAAVILDSWLSAGD